MWARGARYAVEGRPYGTPPLAGQPTSASDATEGYNLGPGGSQVTPPWHPVSGRARSETPVCFTHRIASTTADKVPLSLRAVGLGHQPTSKCDNEGKHP